MTPTEFRAAIAEATTSEGLREIVDQFVPTFTKLSNDDKDKLRRAWNARKAELGVIVIAAAPEPEEEPA